MKPITQEWINKAEADFATAQRELQVQQRPNYDAVCFHAQQCIEKYLKACLQEESIAFTKTHDLNRLHDRYSAGFSGQRLWTEPAWFYPHCSPQRSGSPSGSPAASSPPRDPTLATRSLGRPTHSGWSPRRRRGTHRRL